MPSVARYPASLFLVMKQKRAVAVGCGALCKAMHISQSSTHRKTEREPHWLKCALATGEPCKPSSVTQPYVLRSLSFIYDCGLPQPPAAYPPTLGGQPLIVGIHGLATRQTYCRGVSLPSRWAFTPPFHPYLPRHGASGWYPARIRRTGRRFFSVTLLHPHERQAINLDGALRCSDFPPPFAHSPAAQDCGAHSRQR